MADNEKNRFEIKLVNKEKQEFSVSFTEVKESLDVIEDLLTVKGTLEKQPLIKKIRDICQNEDDILFFPNNKIILPKARWVSVSAAASYPRGVPIDDIVSRTDLTSEKVSAYCTSKNNPTSRYLFRRGDEIFISPDGIDWLFGLLKKDKQIEEVEDTNEEESLDQD
jgi:hypothetical protein